MKEMMGNLAEGEIEFYQSVCCSFNMACFSNYNVFFSGNGRVGADYTYHSTYTGGRLASSIYLILMICSSYSVLLFSRTSCKDFVRNVLLHKYFQSRL